MGPRSCERGRLVSLAQWRDVSSASMGPRPCERGRSADTRSSIPADGFEDCERLSRFLGAMYRRGQTSSYPSQYQCASGHRATLRHLAARKVSECQRTCIRRCLHDVERPAIIRSLHSEGPSDTKRLTLPNFIASPSFLSSRIRSVEFKPHSKLQVVFVVLTDLEDPS
jgi:hypothetical protein